MTASDPMLPRAAVVRRVRRETADTATLEIARADGEPHSDFQPGQFSMLYVFGVGEAPISISGEGREPDGLTYTIRAAGSLTRALVAAKPGDPVGVRGPFGRGWPLEQAKGRDLLLVAGGIGLAPLRTVIHHVLQHRADYGEVALLYGARTPGDLLYRRDLTRWRHRRTGPRVLVTVDQADLEWDGSVGVVTRLFSRIPLVPDRTVVMSCGPEVMMRAAARSLERLGVRGENLYISMERNMTCAIGVCGHCQFGPEFICTDGPVLPYSRLRPWLGVHEL